MLYIVTLSGGKDSLATAIWAKNNLKGENVVYVFCDTGWEHAKTYKHLEEIERDLGIKIVRLTNPNFDNLVDLFIKKKRAASTKARFCTVHLKVEPMIDFILSQNCDITVIQGVRSEESEQRQSMKAKDEFFKFYFEPYGYDKKGKPKYHTYRKKDIKIYCDQYSVDVLRPILKWSAAEVFSYIFENGLRPKPLYFEGFSRVGCFPCVMCRHDEVRLIMELYPERIQEIRELELDSNSTFFPPNYIPTKYCTKKCISKKTGKYTYAPTVDDVLKYLMDDPNQTRLFPVQKGCASVYNICERA